MNVDRTQVLSKNYKTNIRSFTRIQVNVKPTLSKSVV